jgi:acetyl-CoA carboxylase biotin carboxyl carrier protein
MIHEGWGLDGRRKTAGRDVCEELALDLTDDDIAQLLKLIDATPFDEIDIEWKGLKLFLRRGGESPTPIPASSSEPIAMDANEAADEAEPKEPAPESAVSDAPPPAGVDAVRAPTIGTFYRRPEPGAPPFVEEGDTVAEGDTLYLLEVMKVFNAVSAERAGTIEKVCVEDGTLVEFDQTLFHLKPLGE